jgi:aminoglycoside phosphotransferase (APT) family kinase protein
MHMGCPVRFARTVDEACAVLDSKKICELASSLNNGVNCTIEQRKYDGQEHAVLRLLFDNKEQWALRMPINPYGKFPEHDLELPLEIMRSTTMLQQCIFKHGMKVPRVHWSCLQWRENPVGYPVVLMDWIEGQPLDWEALRHHPEATAKVLAHLAQHVFDLSMLTESREALKDLQALQLRGGMSRFLLLI